MAKQASTAKRAKPRRRINRGLTALVAVVFLLVCGAAGMIYWLASTYDPEVDPFGRPELSAAAPSAEPAAEPMQDAGHASATPPSAEAQDSAQQDAANDSHGTPPTAESHDDTHGKAPEKAHEEAPADTQAQPMAQDAGHGDADAAKPELATQDAATDDAQPPAAPAEEETQEVASLTPAPQPDLVKDGPHGPLPVIAPDGRTPLAAYARPYRASGRPRVAIVLADLGMAEAKTIAAIQQLPGQITLAFHPYGRNLQDYVDQARAAGHEVLLEIPMEPLDAALNNPGNYALLTSLPTRTNLERLDWLLGRFSGYVGVVNFMGDRFTTSEPHLRPVLQALQSRGLMFLDRRASARSIAGKVATEIGLPGASSDRQIDTQASRAAINAQLLELERLARGSGQAVGLAYPYPVTIELLSEWARGLKTKGIDLVPTSALVQVAG